MRRPGPRAEAAEAAKIALSDAEETTVTLPGVLPGFSAALTREEMEAACKVSAEERAGCCAAAPRETARNQSFWPVWCCAERATIVFRFG